MASAQYYTTKSGNVRMAAKPSPSFYSDNSRPELSPSDVIRLRAKADDQTLAENCALLRSVSIANGEGHARDNKPWKVGRHEVTMGMIGSESDLLAWLLQPGLVEKVTDESTDTGLHSICYRLCIEDVKFLRVHQKDRHHSVAMEAAANAANLLWACCLDSASTVRVRGKYEGKTLLDSSLESNGGEPFPIMRLVGWLCSLETQSELNRTRLEYNSKQAAELTRRIDNMQADSEQESEVDSWAAYLAKAADDETEGTLRADMFRLYRYMRLDANSAANRKVGNRMGTKSREEVCTDLGWKKNYLARVKMELMISRSYWFKSEKDARADEDYLRAEYQKNIIGKTHYVSKKG